MSKPQPGELEGIEEEQDRAAEIFSMPKEDDKVKEDEELEAEVVVKNKTIAAASAPVSSETKTKPAARKKTTEEIRIEKLSYKTDADGLTRMQKAARLGDVEAIRSLLAQKVNHSFLGDKQISPLCMAVDSKQVEIARMLLGEGASPKVLRRMNGCGNLLHIAVDNDDIKMAEMLLDFNTTWLHDRLGINEGAAGYIGLTPLQLAAQYRREGFVKLFLKKASTQNNIIDEENFEIALIKVFRNSLQTGLDPASSVQSLRIFAMFLIFGQRNGIDFTKHNFLFESIKASSAETVKLLLDFNKSLDHHRPYTKKDVDEAFVLAVLPKIKTPNQWKIIESLVKVGAGADQEVEGFSTIRERLCLHNCQHSRKTRELLRITDSEVEEARRKYTIMPSQRTAAKMHKKTASSGYWMSNARGNNFRVLDGIYNNSSLDWTQFNQSGTMAMTEEDRIKNAMIASIIMAYIGDYVGKATKPIDPKNILRVMNIAVQQGGVSNQYQYPKVDASVQDKAFSARVQKYNGEMGLYTGRAERENDYLDFPLRSTFSFSDDVKKYFSDKCDSGSMIDIAEITKTQKYFAKVKEIRDPIFMKAKATLASRAAT